MPIAIIHSFIHACRQPLFLSVHARRHGGDEHDDGHGQTKRPHNGTLWLNPRIVAF